MKIAVAGTGYVGLSLCVLLAQHNEVVGFDIDADRVAELNARRSPITDPDISEFLATKELDLSFTTTKEDAYVGADFVVIATPTDYDSETNYFNTATVEGVVADVLQTSPTAAMVIKSTIPVGFISRIRETSEIPADRLFFSPEFHREGRALYDNLHPSRIVVGHTGATATDFADLLLAGSLDPDVPVLLTDSTEAEAIKLFANTYLAMRVAYFNELDSFAATHGLNTRQIVDGVGLDPRIGTHHNNPSFGYGGYCLPKDTKQLLANYADVPQTLMQAIVDSNATRMDFIAGEVLRRNPTRVGVHRLIMKAGSDNFRESSVLGVVDRLRGRGIDITIYEPTLDADTFHGVAVTADFEHFTATSDVIIANRHAAELDSVRDKVYSRDLFGTN